MVPNGHSMQNGCLLYKGRLVLPKGSAWIPKIIKEFHFSPLGGHSRYIWTYKRRAATIYLERMKNDMQIFAVRCDNCQHNKYQAMSPAGFLQPLPIPQQVWEDVSMGFIIKLPKSHGFYSIVVVVDHLTKYGHFIPFLNLLLPKTVATVFIREPVKLHGFPKSLVSDQDCIFISQFGREIFKSTRITLNYSSEYHPKPMDL